MDLHEIDDENALLICGPSGSPWIKRTPVPSTPTVDKRCSAVLRGVSHEGRLISGGARNQEPDGDTRRRDSDLDRFGRLIDVIPYVLCLWCIVLIWTTK